MTAIVVSLPAFLVNPARGRRSCLCAGCNSQVQGSGASLCLSCGFCDNPSLQPCYLREALGLLWLAGECNRCSGKALPFWPHGNTPFK